jgi:DNA-binding CsgD family transcriptional regulator/PAS domain-containing protein
MKATELVDLIHLTYASAADARLWPAFLEKYAHAVHASAAALLVQDFRNPRGSAAASMGYDPFWEKRYADYYGSLNPWMQRAPHLYRPGNVLISDRVMSDRELAKTEFYNDFLRPQNHFHSFGCIITQDDPIRSAIAAMRPQSAGEFEEAEEQLLKQLFPHLNTAMRLHERIAGMEYRMGGMMDALNRLAEGVMLVDADGRVAFANRYAEAILRSGDGLGQFADGVRADGTEQTRELRRAIAQVAAGGAGRPMAPGCALTLRRASCRGALKLYIASAKSIRESSRGRPAAVVFIADPEQPRAPDPGTLEQLLDLSPAEARLATSLAQGKTLQDCAGEAAVSLNTVRTHLQRIFSKTGVRRQAELIRLIMTVAPGLSAGA